MNIQVHTWIIWDFWRVIQEERDVYEGEWKDDKAHGTGRYYSRQRSYIRRRMRRRQTTLAQLVCKRIFIFIISKLNKIFNIIKSDWFKKIKKIC